MKEVIQFVTSFFQILKYKTNRNKTGLKPVSKIAVSDASSLARVYKNKYGKEKDYGSDWNMLWNYQTH